jgi:protein O-GlcNAc transferase
MSEDEFQRALLLHRQGRAAEAELLCQEIVRTQPTHAGALHLLGVAALQAGRTGIAVELIGRSLAADPDQPYAQANLGAVLLGLKRFEAALQRCDAALRLAPDQAQTHYNRGIALMELKRSAEAITSFDRALQLKPDYVEALHNRGALLARCHRLAEALESYDHALRLQPHLAETLNNRGNTLRELGRYLEALESCQHALLIRPDFAEALNVRGSVLLAMQRHPEALASFEGALRLRPDFVDALHNRGNALRGLLRLDEALASFERAIQLGEQRPEALANYGWALMESQRYEDAAACMAQVVATEPESKYVLGALLLARLTCCDWTQYRQIVDWLLASVHAGQCTTAAMVLMAVLDAPDVNLLCARAFAADRFPPSPTPAWCGQRYEHDRIRIAYVSGDFRDHVVTRLLAPLIERHDRRQFEVIAISVRPPQDTPIGRRIRAAFDSFHDVSLSSDGQVAALLRELEVDIAVDLGGFTGSQRPGIFAHRGAPLQVSYLGYPGSLGANYFHYLLADSVLISEEDRCHYSEHVVHLPDCYQVNHTERPLPDPGPTRQECGLPPQGVVFCCFNNSFKLTPPVFDVWMRILRQVDGSVLWLAGHRPSVVTNLRAAAAERAVDPQRLVFAERLPELEDHLVRYALADLFLDTFPFNAHATASDALWYGVPVVTCIGKTFAGRVAASLLHAVGLPELITHDPQAYESKVLELASNRPLRDDMHARLMRNRATHPLFDTDRFRRHLESAYRTMWERHQHGEPPASFAVAS